MTHSSGSHSPRHARSDEISPGPPPPPPRRPAWTTVAAAGATAVGCALMAAWVSSREGTDPQVGVAAWVATAVIGTTALVAAAVIEGRPRRPLGIIPENHEARGHHSHPSVE